MASSETKKKCPQYSINLFGGEWKLNLVVGGGASSKSLRSRALVYHHEVNLFLYWFSPEQLGKNC